MFTFDEIKTKVFDGSGIDHNNQWLWEATNGVYYPVRPLEGTKFARKCSITGKGMNEGYCFHDGGEYAIGDDAANQVAVKLGYIDYNDAVNKDAAYWTEWDDKEDYQYIVRNGELVEIEG